MDYYESTVIDYVRADRALFVNRETCIQINEAENPDTSGPHWYCDAVTLDLRAKEVFLLEISYSSTLSTLIKRLASWHQYWQEICSALVRDSHAPVEWPVRTWLFVPEVQVAHLAKKLIGLPGASVTLHPRITPLEMVQPWRYKSWNRQGEAAKPDTIPVSMRE